MLSELKGEVNKEIGKVSINQYFRHLTAGSKIIIKEADVVKEINREIDFVNTRGTAFTSASIKFLKSYIDGIKKKLSSKEFRALLKAFDISGFSKFEKPTMVGEWNTFKHVDKNGNYPTIYDIFYHQLPSVKNVDDNELLIEPLTKQEMEHILQACERLIKALDGWMFFKKGVGVYKSKKYYDAVDSLMKEVYDTLDDASSATAKDCYDTYSIFLYIYDKMFHVNYEMIANLRAYIKICNASMRRYK